MKQTSEILDELLRDIDSYFECTLSDEQEQYLRRQIATTTLSHPAIDEARAVMGLRRNVSRHAVYRRVVAAAAATAMLVGVAMMLFRFPLSGNDNIQPQCVAYIDGRYITDENEVFELMSENLHQAAEIIDSYETINIEF